MGSPEAKLIAELTQAIQSFTHEITRRVNELEKSTVEQTKEIQALEERVFELEKRGSK